MKKGTNIILTLILLLPALGIQGKEKIKAEFSEGVDLLATVWQLAGAEEYNRCAVTPYATSHARHFAGARTHKAVELARTYYRDGTGYDAVAEFGCMITTEGGRVAMDSLKRNTLDNRWTQDMQEEFIIALDDFYRQTDFGSWYASTATTRTEAISAFKSVADEIDTAWYGRFFGGNGASFKIILSLLVGQNNYGISSHLTDGTLLLTPVMGCAEYKDGHIVYDGPTVLPILVHEFCHAYCNPLVDAFYADMEPSLLSAYAYDKRKLSSQAYTTPRTMMYETLVRSSVIRYLASHKSLTPQQRRELIGREEALGFVLTETTEESLAAYEAAADGTKGLTPYMPELVRDIGKFSVKAYAKRRKAEKAAADKLRVHYRCSIKDGARNITPGPLTLSITFDSPMEEGISIGMTDKEIPEYESHTWSDDHRTLSILFHTRPSTTYGMLIMGEGFVSHDGRRAVESELTFTTRREQEERDKR